jgi:uncharacterized membrane protein YgdD (TMEM256/DUF423 family)
MNVQSVLAAFRSEVVLLIRSIARLLVAGVLMFVGLLIVSVILRPTSPTRSAPRKLDERILSISPNVQAVVIPLMAFSIFFGAFYLNIQRAKKRVSYWRPGSSYLFIRSHGLLGVKVRTRRVWMKELGYEEREALIIAACQERAIVMNFAGWFALFAILYILFGP